MHGVVVTLARTREQRTADAARKETEAVAAGIAGQARTIELLAAQTRTAETKAAQQMRAKVREGDKGTAS